jgi:predicted S18 family serine protease
VQVAANALTDRDAFDILQRAKDSYFEIEKQKTAIEQQVESTQMLVQRLKNYDTAYKEMSKTFTQIVGLSHMKVYGKESPLPPPPPPLPEIHSNGSK